MSKAKANEYKTKFTDRFKIDDETKKNLAGDTQSLLHDQLIQLGTGGVAAAGSLVDSVTGDVNIVNTPVQSLQEAGLNYVQSYSNALAGSGIGAAAGYLTRKNKGVDEEEVNAQVKKEAQDIMRKDGETAGKQYFADNKVERGSSGLNAQQKADNIRRTTRGAAIGVAASLVPTLLGMRDREQLANQSASLM